MDTKEKIEEKNENETKLDAIDDEQEEFNPNDLQDNKEKVRPYININLKYSQSKKLLKKKWKWSNQ